MSHTIHVLYPVVLSKCLATMSHTIHVLYPVVLSKCLLCLYFRLFWKGVSTHISQRRKNLHRETKAN